MKELVRLVYASTIAGNFDPAELDKILAVAREHNAREAITGVLFFTTDHFIQCLEGSRKALNVLYSDIMGDPRHHDLVLLGYDDIEERMFASWEMAYIGPHDISKKILDKYFLGASFDPYSLDQAAAQAMVRLLAEHLKKKA